MFYTSYYSFLDKLDKDIIPVSIAQRTPVWYSGLVYKKLSPSWDILLQYKQLNNTQLYTQRFYEEILNNLNPIEVQRELIDLAQSENIVLVCYEKSDSFCHRHLVADWFNANGIPIMEIKNGRSSRK